MPPANTLCAWHTMRNVCEGHILKNEILNFAIRTLQNEDFLHFYSKIFGHFKKKVVSLHMILKKNLTGLYIVAIMQSSQITFIY